MIRTLISFFLAILFFSCKKKKEVLVSPVVSSITEAVFAPGRIEADEQFMLTAISDGYVRDILVSEGDSIKGGQVLLVQDNATAAVQQKTATENLEIAETQASAGSAILQQLYAQLDAANAKLENDRKQLDVMERLYLTSSVAGIDVDNARLAYSNSLGNTKAIQQNIAATRLTLRQSVINSRGQQETASINNGYYSIKSPGNYTVYSLLKKKGELVRKGEAVAVLGKSGSMKMVLSVDETSITKIKVGQQVLAGLNTEKEITHTGSISKIYPVFDVAAQAYTVEAVFDNTVPGLINGTLLQSNVIVAKKERVTLIPRNCLGADGKVWVRRSGKTDTVAVTTGIVSTEWVEIIAGLKPADKVVKQF